MYLVMVTNALLRRKLRMFIALLAVAIGATIISGMITVYKEVPEQMGREFRAYGANLLLLPANGKTTMEEAAVAPVYDMLKDKEIIGAAPFLYERLKINESPVLTGGTDFNEIRKVSPYWQINGEMPKENSKENFFEEEARLWAEVYGKQSDKPDLESLQRMLENMNHLLLSLELPWERFIPILYRSFALYMRRPDENTNNRKAYQLSAQLMDSVVYLSQHTNLIHHIHLFCNMQIAALEKLKNEKVEIEQTED
mgnify:CR=1 FL=1